MPAKRGRTISTFGQAFMPVGISGGSAIVRKVMEAVTLTVERGGQHVFPWEFPLQFFVVPAKPVVIQMFSRASMTLTVERGGQHVFPWEFPLQFSTVPAKPVTLKMEVKDG